MMNSSATQTASQRQYASAAETELIESLESMLTYPWRLKYPEESLDVRAGAGINYTPNFLIMNETTGRALAVEIKNSLSLSLPNIIKLQHIQSAFKNLGTDFLVVVHGDVSEDAGANARLSHYGINAVGVSRAIDAARAIEKQLAP